MLAASVWQDIGQRLAKKPFTRMSWWRSKQWVTVFFIVPRLTEEQPLWKRDETTLWSLLLFNVESKDLEAELHAYWKRPFWQRWYLGLVTSIHDKCKVWSYYQCCLAFARVQKQQANLMDSLFESSGEERMIRLKLRAWFDQDIKQCEKWLEQHAGDLNWQQGRLASIVSHYEKKTEQKLLKCMEKKLNQLPSARRRIKKEYQELVQVMRDYLLYPLRSEQAHAHNDEATDFGAAATAPTDTAPTDTEPAERVSDRQTLVYVGPAVAGTRHTLSPRAIGKISLGDMDSVGDWVSLKRAEIANVLAEARDEAYREIKDLLAHCLNSIRMLIEPQLVHYQELIHQVRERQVAYWAAIEYSENLQRRLMRFFRTSVLLFHPDKSNGNEELSRIQVGFFPEFRELSETSRETLRVGLERLKDYGPQSEAEIQKILDEIERDRQRFSAELAQIGKAIEQMRIEREEAAAKRAQMKAEMDADIEELRQAILLQNRSQAQTHEETIPHDQERSGVSAPFFARR